MDTNANKIYFSVPDLLYTKGLVFFLMEQKTVFKDFFNEDTEIDSIHGNYELLWKSGRLKYYPENISTKVYNSISPETYPLTGVLQKSTFFEPAKVRELFRICNESNLGVRLNLANNLITEDMLDDQISNVVLTYTDKFKEIKKPLELSVSSPVLKEYLETKYPKFKIIWDESLIETDIEKINELSENNVITIDTCFNNDFDSLSLLKHPENIEIQVGSPCMDDCPYKKDHLFNNNMYALGYPVNEKSCYDYLKVNNQSTNESGYDELKESFKFANFYNTQKTRKHYISLEDIREKYLPMGFNKFKIPDCNTSWTYLMEIFINYFVKPENRNDIRSDFLRQFFSIFS